MAWYVRNVLFLLETNVQCLTSVIWLVKGYWLDVFVRFNWIIWQHYLWLIWCDLLYGNWKLYKFIIVKHKSSKSFLDNAYNNQRNLKSFCVEWYWKVVNSQLGKLTHLRHLIPPMVYSEVRVWPIVKFVFLTELLRLITSLFMLFHLIQKTLVEVPGYSRVHWSVSSLSCPCSKSGLLLVSTVAKSIGGNILSK
jgi:hypothetical protein